MVKYALLGLSALCVLSSQAQIDYRNFTGEEAKVTFAYQFPFVNLYDYTVDAVGDSLITGNFGVPIAEQSLITKYSSDLANNVDDSIVFAISLQSRMIIEIGLERHTLIKYREVRGGGQSSFLVMDLISESGAWVENQSTSEQIETLKSILRLSSVGLLFKLFGTSTRSIGPLIIELRPMVKNDAGHLDIDKLNEVLKNNQNRLVEYLD